MFDLLACMKMGWIVRVEYGHDLVTLYLENGKRVHQNYDAFFRQYRVV